MVRYTMRVLYVLFIYVQYYIHVNPNYIQFDILNMGRARVAVQTTDDRRMNREIEGYV